MSSTGVFRKVRRSVRKLRGLGLEVLLPVAGLAAGVLAGVLVWQGLKGWALDHRAQVDLRVGPQARAEDAAQALAERVGDERFRAQWLHAAPDDEGLAGGARLQAEVVDKARGEVRLVCLGRPRDAAVKALARARDRLRDRNASGIAPLMPVGHAREQADLAKELAEEREGLKPDEERLQKARSSLEGDKEAVAAAARLERDKAACESARMELAAAGGPAAEARRQELLAEKARLLPAGGTLPQISEAEERRLRGELVQLDRLLSDEARRDSTARHPVVRRMEEVAGRLKAADLAREIEKSDKDLERLKALKAKLAGAEAALEKDQKIAARNDQKLKEEREASDAVASRRNKIKALDDRSEKLGAVPGVPLEVAAASVITEELTRAWLVWPCLAGGLAVGVVLAVLLRRYALARFSLVNDEAALADCLRAPVLGVVPALAGLAARQE